MNIINSKIMFKRILIGIISLSVIIFASLFLMYQNESDLERFSRKTQLNLLDCGEILQDHVMSIGDGVFFWNQCEEQVHINGFYTGYDFKKQSFTIGVIFELIPNPSDTFAINSIYFTENRIELETTQYNCEINGNQEMLEIIYATLLTYS